MSHPVSKEEVPTIPHQPTHLTCHLSWHLTAGWGCQPPAGFPPARVVPETFITQTATSGPRLSASRRLSGLDNTPRHQAETLGRGRWLRPWAKSIPSAHADRWHDPERTPPDGRALRP